MFENDHSAARGKMAVRELIVFKHDSELGCAPAHKLFDLVKAAHKDNVTAPRSYEDYTVTVDEAALPAGVTCTRLGGSIRRSAFFSSPVCSTSNSAADNGR